MERGASWAEVLAQGRAPRFALICLGVWLNAADSLVTATVMPSVGRSLGGYAYFGWATAVYLLGSVLAGASSGLLARKFGLRTATFSAACLYAIGCAISAGGPNIASFLIGRVLQGVGGGWVVGFSSVAIGLLFPNRTLPRVYAATTSIWGVASLLGPLVGGVFAGAGLWRWAFWSFAGQGVAMAGAAAMLLPKGESVTRESPMAWSQLALIALGVAAIGLADVASGLRSSGALTVVGAGLLLVMVWYDERAVVRLLPRGAGNLATAVGAGYAAQFLMTAASMGYSIYGPALLQTLAGLGPLAAGYVTAIEAAAWTGAGLAVSGLAGAWPGRMIRLGSLLALAGVVASGLVFPRGNVGAIAAAGVLLGAGFGLSWAFISQRILVSLLAGERTLGAAGITTVRLTGSAAGAAVAAAAANLAGVSHRLTATTARTAGLWVFVVAIPIAAAAVGAAWRLGGADSAGDRANGPMGA